MEYKQYHEADGNTFHSPCTLYFSQCDMNRRMSLNELLRLTSDVAVEDYRQRGMSREFLAENGFGILVSRCSYRIHRWPVENERIEVVTWEERPQPLQLIRCYKVISDSSELLVSGRSAWIVVDLKARRIIPSKAFTLRKPSDIRVDMDCMEPGKISGDGGQTLVSTRKICFSDIDSNGHTNNSRYAAFIADALPQKFRSTLVKDFRINFSREALLNDELSIFMSEAENKLIFIGKTDKATSFEAEVYF